MTPLQILQGYSNVTLQGLDEPALQAAIDSAALECSRAAYGSMWPHQVADLAAHDLLSEAFTSGSGGGDGSGQAVSERAIGKRRVRYGQAGATYIIDPRSDEGLQRTIYGQRFMRRRSQVSISALTTGMDF